MTREEILTLLRTRLAVDAAVAMEALGIGKFALEGAIRRGACPAVDLGRGAKRRSIPCWWILQQLRLPEEESLQQLGLPEGEPLLQLQREEQEKAAS